MGNSLVLLVICLYFTTDEYSVLCTEYNEQGYPKNYRGKSLEWKGNRLVKNGEDEYLYDAAGIRREKKENGKTHTYHIHEGRLIAEEIWSGGIAAKKLRYLYMGEEIIGITIDEIPYFYQRDVSGNIVRMCDKLGNIVARYTYDACASYSRGNQKNKIKPLKNKEKQLQESCDVKLKIGLKQILCGLLRKYLTCILHRYWLS